MGLFAILGAIWAIVAGLVSFVLRVVIPVSSKFYKWIVAAAALWPFSLPVLLGYGALVAAPKAAATRFKKEKVGQ